MNNHLIELYLKDIGSIYNKLTYEKQKSLAIDYSTTGNLKYRDKLVGSVLPLVIHLASRYKNQGVSLTDLIQEGNVGAILAAEKYNGSSRFTSYAGFWIKREIFFTLNTQKTAIRMPDYLSTLIYKLKLGGVYDLPLDELDVKSLAKKYKVSSKRILYALNFDFSVFSTNDGETERIIEDKSDKFVFKTDWYDVEFYLSLIPKKDKKIIELRYGLNGSKENTLEKVGKVVGLSKERVRQIIEKNLDIFRDHSNLN